MLAPKKMKYRKRQKGMPISGKAQRGSTLAFGEFALLALEAGRVTNRQIEAGRVATNRKIKRQGRMWIRIFPDVPVTRKPAETRMGKGKGSPEEWVVVVKPGRILYELDGVSEEMARDAFRLAGAKLPIKTRFLARSEEL